MEYRYIDIFTEKYKNYLGVDNTKLTTICDYYGINVDEAHRALKDCCMTFECYPRVNELFPNGFEIKVKNTRDIEKYLFKDKIDELRFRIGEIIQKGDISKEEFFELKEWVDSNVDLSGKEIYDNIISLLDNTDMNNEDNSDVLSEVFSSLKLYYDPVTHYASIEKIDTLSKKHVCLTGEFENGKENVIKLIIDAGAKIDNNVGKKTEYLIVGGLGSANWKNGSYGNKIKDAIQRIRVDNSVVLMEESVFVPQLMNILEQTKNECVADFDQIWQSNIQEVIDDLIEANELPKNSLRLQPNKAKQGDEITSYSLFISGFEYPASSNASVSLFNIKHNPIVDKRIMDIICSKDYCNKSICPEDANYKSIKADSQNVVVRIRKDSNNLSEFFSKLINKAIDGFALSVSSFACCSKYVECSDAKKCLHENKLYSKSCLYRTNLEKGLIFYGKNSVLND